MHARCRLIGLLALSALALGSPRRGAAQDLRDFPYADSLSQALQLQGRWRALDSVGRLALRVGTDYPALRRRLGLAAWQQRRPVAALRQYRRALAANPLDSVARHGLVLAHLGLNQREAAAFHARALPDSLRGLLHLRSFYAVQRVELEASGQTTTLMARGNAGFTRLGVGSQLRPWFFLTQGISYFSQTVQLPELRAASSYAVRQWEYHGLVSGQLRADWQARLGYHYLGSRFGTATFPGHLLYAALVYSRPSLTAQAGFYAGTITDTARSQADMRLTVYPLGSLKVVAFGRGSLVRSGGHSLPNALLGVGSQLRPWCWVEAFGSLGRVPVLAEADGAYVYNLLDPLRRKVGGGVYLTLPRRVVWRVHYTAEQRARALTTTTYGLSTLSTALLWTW